MPHWPKSGGRYEEVYTGTKAKAGHSQDGSAATSRQSFGGQGVHREVESEGFAENHRVVLNGSDPTEEPVGPSWGMVEPAVGRRRRYGSSPAYPGVGGRHGGEETAATQGDLSVSNRKGRVRYCGTRRRKGEQRRRQTATYSPRR